MNTAELVIAWSACVAYALTSVIVIHHMIFASRRAVKLAMWAAVAGALLHLGSLVVRTVASGHLPVMGNYETASAAALFAALPVAWITLRREDLRLPILVAVPVIMLALGWAILKRDAVSPLTPPFQSTWLVIHVLFANLSFGGFVLACGGGACWLLVERRQRLGTTGGWLDRLPSLDSLDDLTFRFALFGFVNEAVMIVAGAFWADALWGKYWGWDPVEVWSLLNWLVYGLYVHLRVIHKWRGKRMAWLAVVSMITVFIMFWGVNVFESSAHRLMAM